MLLHVLKRTEGVFVAPLLIICMFACRLLTKEHFLPPQNIRFVEICIPEFFCKVDKSYLSLALERQTGAATVK